MNLNNIKYHNKIVIFLYLVKILINDNYNIDLELGF